MLDLGKIRDEIDATDDEIVRLFQHRMALTAEVAQYKIETGKAVFDAERERQKLEKLTGEGTNAFNTKGIQELFQQIMSISRKRQYQLLTENGGEEMTDYTQVDHLPTHGRRVVFQGVEGAYSFGAMKEFFDDTITSFHVDTWKEAMEAITRGEADYAVLPIENSTAGIVSDIYDLLVEYPHYIVGEQELPVEHVLMALPGAKAEEIRTVISHPQALAQSSVFVQQHGFKTSTWGNTADAARHVAELNDPSVAAIASAETAGLYGLQILSTGINADGDNTTRFIVIERAAAAPAMTGEGQRLALLFTARHKPGQLAAALDQIGARGFNMECIKSRPLPHVPFEYYFYVQIVCPAGSTGAGCQTLLDTLTSVCSTLRLLGAFTLDSTEK